MTKPVLKIAPVARDAAKFACERWHYSGILPPFAPIFHGVWEDGEFIGVIIYGRGSTPQIGKPFGLQQTQVCELVRVALRDHRTPVSRMIAISLRILRRSNPGLRLVVSFADDIQGHHGGIYQAGGWIYLGANLTRTCTIYGKPVNWRTIAGKYGRAWRRLAPEREPGFEWFDSHSKHKYVMPLDDEIRETLTPLAKPYPKRRASGDDATV